MYSIIIKRSEEKGYVSSISPLAYTKIKKDAHRIPFDFSSYDADTVENELWKPLESIIDQSFNLDWMINVENEEEEVLAKVLCSGTGVMISVKDELEASEVRAIREVFTGLADYIMSKSLEMSVKPMAELTEVYPTAVADSPTSCSRPSTIEDPTEEIVKRIEARTKASITKPKETLADYVCNATLRSELEEIRDFFEHKERYVEAGIKLPKGILFKGVPGTGKTYAARCIAGSVDCYFMSCTASSLQGMYVGSGAENIKQVFDGAKALHDASKKGVLVFIDELDSFGSRDSHGGNAGGEEDRTLNQLLAEMSGFEDAEGIMVLGATNYPERIDDALMRSGRFSRQITIDLPDETERFSLVEYYFKKLKLKYDEDCDVAAVAALTTGLTPADIAEIVNEAGILTIRNKLTTVYLDAVNEAVNKVITKNIRKPDRSEDFHNLVAIHESGHVLAEWIYKKEFSVKVTNYSYGDAGGFTQPRFSKDSIISKEDYKNSIMVLLGGRAAEEVLCGAISTGASEDFARASKKIKAYYETYQFEQYEVAKLDQLVEDTLHSWYRECVTEFSIASVKDRLARLADALISERVLYTRDIASII